MLTSVDQVSSRHDGRPLRIQLREMTGLDEQSVSATDTATAIRLLDRLIVREPGSVSVGFRAIDLNASERDQLLARVYELTFGPRIESTARCSLCESRFDLAFAIEDLLTALDATPSSSTATREKDGVFRLRSGARFRLPTGEDELAAAKLPLREAEVVLMEHCLLEPERDLDSDALQKAMEEHAPILDVELHATCPECGGQQFVRFDVQFYLLRALEQQRKSVAREVHRLALAYGWSLNEILGLSLSQRRAFVELIDADSA
jgi:hypothetical protein